jgi:hypothetical protein
MSKESSSSFTKKAESLALRFIKFNLVGTLVFLVGTAIYVVAFSSFGFWTWLLANGAGSVLQFSLINLLNRTQKGRIFDSCEQKSNP